MTRIRLTAVALATVTALVLGGCGSDRDEDAAPPAPSSVAPVTGAPPAPSTKAPTATRTTPRTATTAPAEEPAVGPGTFIDYEAVDEDGVTVTAPADVADLTGAPAGFKNFIAALIEKQTTAGTEGCSEPPRITVTQVDTGGWARGSYLVPGCGGSGALWAVSRGSWTQAWTGQSLVDCATLERYDFPSRLAGDTCDSGNGSKPYRG